MGDAEQPECSTDVQSNHALLAVVAYDSKSHDHDAQNEIHYRYCIQDETSVTHGSSVRIKGIR